MVRGIVPASMSFPASCALLASVVLTMTAEARTQETGPQTVAEASGYTRTSRHREVLAFLHAVEQLPCAKRLRRLSFGKTTEGRELPLVIVSEPPLADDREVMRSGKLRLLVNANIHAGEVEGKEAVLILLRELANGKHEDLLEHAVLFWVPNFNPDGNEKISKRHRRGQNGPAGGVGLRPNAQGFDLNRDFIKVDTPETRAMHGLWNRYDPHLFMDLHTTNGSAHGYHLTYAPSLSANVDSGLRDFARKTLLQEIRTAMKKRHGYRVYDYGNFNRKQTTWSTYDHRPRFGTNCFGLRNRIAVLSEAYSYLPFEDRVRVTRAFVLETLRAAVRHREQIRKLCAAADERIQQEGVAFQYDTGLEAPWEDEILVGRGSGAVDDHEARKIEVRVAFVARRSLPLPRAWAIHDPPGSVLDVLQAHGVEYRKLTQTRRVVAEVFQPTEVRKRRRVFQKHFQVRISGSYTKQEVELEAGTVWVSGRQRLARLAAQDLEAVSEDSLATWNCLDEQLRAKQDGGYPPYPVLRVLAVKQPKQPKQSKQSRQSRQPKQSKQPK